VAQLKTLRNIIDCLTDHQKPIEQEEAGHPPRESSPDVVASPTTSDEISEDTSIQRYTLTAIEKPPTVRAGVLASNLPVIITDDENGVASALTRQLRERGRPVALVQMGKTLYSQDSDNYTVNLTSPEEVEHLLDIIRKKHGPIGGLVHLLPLKDGESFEEMDLKKWRERLSLEVKSLFYMAKSLRQDIENAARDNQAFLVAATKMGGTFASVSQGGMTAEAGQFFPSQGGVCGLLKTISVEWPEVNVRAIDTNSLEYPATLVEKLSQAIAADDKQVEVGYPDSRRFILQPVPAPLDKENPATLDVDSSWVIMVTGGTQGITADAANELAKRYQPTLLLVGRSPLPEPEESEETTGLTDKKLKAALMASLRGQSQSIMPSKVEAAYKRLLKDREMRRNITAMQSHGAKVQYFQVDVRDEIEFGNVIDQIYKSYGRLDGVIHGAGIIDDKLVRDKSIESFDRVFDTKTESAFILSRKLKPDSLKFLIFFSSVAGRFGNQGQCDYTAANEVYNKLAVYLDKHWPGRVVSIMWGPWARSGGMVSRELEKQFAKSGVVLVPPSVGVQKLDEELRYGRKGEAEVIIAGAQTLGTRTGMVQLSGQGKTVKQEKSLTPSLPLIGSQASLSRGAAGSVEIERYLDVSHDLYLQDHRLDGKPVLPMAMAQELMAEAVSLGWPELKITAVKDMNVLQGIVIEDGPKPVRVVAVPKSEPGSGPFDIEVSILAAEGKAHPYYRASIVLAEQPLAPVELEPPSLAEAEPFPMTVSETYRQWLFHGPLFQKISHIDGISPNGMVASMITSSPQDSIAGANQQQWLIDPMIIDSGLQLVLVWVKRYRDMMVLPSRFSIYRHFGSMAGPEIKCHLTVRSSPNKPLVYSDLAFFSANGRLLGLLENVEGICSRSLNRVAGSNPQQGVVQ
jgi:NAD(P)-dependent dehydrogenase (short-subunit alcohol dehydrogenase family)